MRMGIRVEYEIQKKGQNALYPVCAGTEQYFTLLIVIGKKEAPFLEALLPHLDVALQEIIHETAEGNGQRWLMIDVEDEGALYQDIWKLIALRAGCYDTARSD